MELDSILHDRQSEAGSAHIAGSAFFYTVETLEDLIQMFLRNTLACIIICKVAELLDRAVTFNVDRYVASCIFEAVLHKILDYGVYQCLVSCQNSSWLKHVLDLDPVCDDPFSEFFEDLV